MSKRSFILCGALVVVAVVSVFCYLTLWRNRAPCIAFLDSTRYDFGVVDEAASVKHEFRFENQGGSNLEIQEVKTGCGCTSAEVAQKLLRPGDNGKVVVTYTGRPTPRRETIPVWIVSNDPDHQVARLIMTGNVRTKVYWSPESVSFHCKQGTPNQFREVQFRTHMRGEFRIRAIVISTDKIAASWQENEKGIKCRISLSPSCPRGNSAEGVTLEFFINNDVREVHIPVYLLIQ
jgi:hypothetical protein